MFVRELGLRGVDAADFGLAAVSVAALGIGADGSALGAMGAATELCSRTSTTFGEVLSGAE